MEESSWSPDEAASLHENKQREHGSQRKDDTIRIGALELQEGKLVEGGLAVWVIMARIGSHAADMQFERMVVTVERFMIYKGMKMHAEPLHHQERQHEAPHQRAMARGSEQAGRKHGESLCDFRQVVQAGGVFVDTPTGTP